MLYSKSTEYAIQAMIYLAEKDSPDPILISEIAKGYNIPQQFLAKIVQTLVKHHLLIAIRGRKGGIKLGRSANKIYLNQIVSAVEGPPPENEPCVIGLDDCSDTTPCPLHDRWQYIRDSIRDMTTFGNLDYLAKRVIEKRLAMNNSRGIEI